MDKEHYIAIIGDIVDSRKITDRKQVQKELKNLRLESLSALLCLYFYL